MRATAVGLISVISWPLTASYKSWFLERSSLDVSEAGGGLSVSAVCGHLPIAQWASVPRTKRSVRTLRGVLSSTKVLSVEIAADVQASEGIDLHLMSKERFEAL